MDEKEYEVKNQFGEIEEIEDEVDKRFKQFKNFNILPHPPFDHGFIFSNKQKFAKQIFSGIDFSRHRDLEDNFTRKMKEEWEILEANLPSSIFVTTYESRIDLMRVCIIGLEGTPYCYGLLFFDISFPSNYPSKPPEIFYHSCGFDLNPNLHADGRVSLNLLSLNRWNKWLGPKEQQKWNPKQSSILQVLLSIQHLILNDKPYFGRALCLHIIEEKASKYNNEVFIQSCEAMLHTLKSSLSNFHEFVQGHFRKRAHRILMIYKSQMNCHSNKAMKQLFFKLVMAFEANGAYCRHHYSIAELEELKYSQNKEEFATNLWVQTQGCGRRY